MLSRRRRPRIAVGVILSFFVWATLGPIAAPPARAYDGETPDDLRSTARLPSDFLLGLEAAQSIARHYGLVETDSLVQRVNDIGYAVALAAGRPDILFTFQILDMDEPNAMALPGGWIFLTRGILEVDLTDAELAHLIAHEITHVTNAHFARQGRYSGLLSLLHTAAIVAIVVAGSESSPGRPVIEDPDTYGYPQSSRDAALSGTAVFGSVFQELLLRGYGRKLEVEADDGGRRLAALAGYPREGGAALLQKLHDRIYEDHQFGYWRTHPYFTDRVAVARAAAPGSDRPPPKSSLISYRDSVQRGMAEAAASFRSERLADYLYGLALRAGTGGGSNLQIQSELFGFRLGRMERRSPILRPYGPLCADYDSLLARGRRADGDPEILGRIAATRDTVDARREALLPRYIEAIDGPNPSTQIMEMYLENFPRHERADPVRLRVARGYRLSGRPDLAAAKLGDLLEHAEPMVGDADSTDGARARVELLRTLPLTEDPAVCQDIYRRVDDPELREAALDRLSVIADTLGVLEEVARFVQIYPESPVAQRFEERLAALADAEYKQGRLHEALGDRQSALGLYNRLAILAPGTQAAAGARQGIMRIQAFATSEAEK